VSTRKLAQTHRKQVAARRVAGQTVSEITEALGINRASVVKLLHQGQTLELMSAMRAMQADKLIEMYELVLTSQIKMLKNTKDPREMRQQLRTAMRLLTLEDGRGGPGRGGGNPALMAQQIQVEGNGGGGFTIRQLLAATRTEGGGNGTDG